MSPDQESRPLVVIVDAAGSLYLNIGDAPDQPVEGDALVQRVAAVLRRQPAKPVMVRGDHSADYGSVVAAMVLLQQAGAPSVGLITQPPEER